MSVSGTVHDSVWIEGTGKSRNKETRNETKRHFKVERSWRSCACAPSLMVLADGKGSESSLQTDAAGGGGPWWWGWGGGVL